MPEVSLDCFLLTRQWRDGPSGLELSFWGRSESGTVRVIVEGESAVTFIPREAALPSPLGEDPDITRRPLALRDLAGGAVDGLYFRFQRALTEARDRLRRHGVQVFESDLKPSDRYLMERFVTAAFNVRGVPRARDRHLEFRNPAITRVPFRPRLAYAVIDIETSGFDGELYSIAVCGRDRRRVFMVSDATLDTPDLELVCCRDEREALRRFFHWMSGADPDLVLGWNVLNFDLAFLQRRCEALGLGFALARGGEGARILEPQSPAGVRVARVPGRVVLDGIDLLRAAFWSFESFELEHVARTMLGRGKRLSPGTDKLAEIRRLYREDPLELARYNLEDCRLVEDIFEHARLVDFAMRRAEMTGLAMDRWADPSPRSTISTCPACIGAAGSRAMSGPLPETPEAAPAATSSTPAPVSTTMSCCSTSRACTRASSAPSGSTPSDSPSRDPIRCRDSPGPPSHARAPSFPSWWPSSGRCARRRRRPATPRSPRRSRS